MFPWSAALVISTGFTNPRCNAVIITRNYLLSASNCILGAFFIPPAWVMFGCTDLGEPDDCQTRPIREIVFSEDQGFSGRFAVQDLAIVKIAGPSFAFDETVRPACLPFELPGEFVQFAPASDGALRRMKVVGWGETFEGGQPSDILRQADVITITDEQCEAAYAPLQAGEVFPADEVLCAVRGNGNICPFDVGGFLGFQRDDDDRWVVDGIASFLGEPDCDSSHPAGFIHIGAWEDYISNVIRGVTPPAGEKPTLPQDGGMIELDEDTPCVCIESPNFGNGRYEADTLSMWIVQRVGTCDTLTFTFEDGFDVPGPDAINCRNRAENDYVRITNRVDGGTYREFACGRPNGGTPDMPDLVGETAADVEIVFRSDRATNTLGNGFRLEICAIC